MAIRIKTFTPNEIYFITFTILGWKHIFINDRYCDLVYKWFDYMKEKYGNKIYGYVIMPNHIHCIIKITDKSPKLSILIPVRVSCRETLTGRKISLLRQSLLPASSESPEPRRSRAAGERDSDGIALKYGN